MDVFQSVKGRRSIRNFKTRDIPDEIIDMLIDALIWAPSSGNLQARKFYFVRDRRLKEEIASAALNQTFIADAPLVIVGCADYRIASRYGDRGVTLYTIQDVAASVMGMMLCAYEHGLGTVWIGAFRESEVSTILHLPHHLTPVAIVPVGYPSRVPPPTPRVSRTEAVLFR